MHVFVLKNSQVLVKVELNRRELGFCPFIFLTHRLVYYCELWQATSVNRRHVKDVAVKPGTHWRQSRLLPEPVTNRQQSRLSPIRSPLLPIRSTLLPMCTGPKQHRLLSTKSTVLNSTLLPVCTELKLAIPCDMLMVGEVFENEGRVCDGSDGWSWYVWKCDS